MRNFVIAATLLLLAGCGQSEAEKAKSQADMKEIKLQRMALEFLEPTLKDAKSAEYRNRKGLCGEVNSKNSMGGYTGFQRFIAAGNGMVALEKDSGLSAADFNQLWGTACSS